MRRETRPLPARPRRVMLSGVSTIASCYKARESERHRFARYPDAGRLWYFMEYFFSLIEKAATLAQTMRMPPMAKGIM